MLTCVTLLSAGCATDQARVKAAAEETEWIKIGSTTREEVIKRFGDPDATAEAQSSEIVVYRPRRPPSPGMVIPSPEAGPLGTVTTRTRPIEPGLGTSPIGRGEKPSRTIWIRYDAGGVVQQVSFERLPLGPIVSE
jgi:hypothetical protein